MIRVLSYIFVFLLTAYGAFSLMHCIISSIRFRVKDENSGIELVLFVKNKEEAIEGTIRSILSHGFPVEIPEGGYLTVVDMGSEDRTVEILKKLQRDYANLNVLCENEKEKLFSISTL